MGSCSRPQLRSPAHMIAGSLLLLLAGACSSQVTARGGNNSLKDGDGGSGVPGPMLDAPQPQEPGTYQAQGTCDGSHFADVGLPGIQMTDATGEAVAGDWNHDGAIDLAVANPTRDTVSVVIGRRDGTFLSRTDYATGSGPSKIAAGDLDGDGNADLVIANEMGSSASILFGNPDGTFAPKIDYATGQRPSVVAIDDWTSDGHPDFIAGDTLFVGKGDGTFAPGAPYGYAPAALVSSDVDRDGHLDLIVEAAGQAAVLLGRGDGTFATKSAVSLEDQRASSMASGDLNADGIPDLIIEGICIGEGDRHTYVFLGAGDGTLGSEAEYTDGPCDRPMFLTDVNGDGKVDLQFTPIDTWLGNGDGTFQTGGFASSPASTDSLLAMADWNGDGRLDFAVLDRESMLKVLPGNGTGAFGQLSFYPFAGMGGPLVDLDGDGKLDLASLSSGTDGPSSLFVWRGHGDGTFGSQATYPLGMMNVTSVQVGDLNGDGNPDLVTTRGASDEVTVTLASGPGIFGFSQDYHTRSQPIAAAIGDVDGDGKADVVTVNDTNDNHGGYPNATIGAHLGNGDGTFRAEVATDTGVNNGINLSVLEQTIADLDGDGRLDVALVTQQGQDPSLSLAIYFGAPDGTFRKGDFSASVPLSPLAVGDLNRDGKPDLVLGPNLLVGQDPAGLVTVWLGTGGGSFAPAVTYPVAAGVNAALDSGVNASGILGLADVNGDGALDLVVETDRIAVLLGRGDGTFSCTETYDRDFSPSQIFLGDLNHDGKSDVVAAQFVAPPLGLPGSFGLATVLTSH